MFSKSFLIKVLKEYQEITKTELDSEELAHYLVHAGFEAADKGTEKPDPVTLFSALSVIEAYLNEVRELHVSLLGGGNYRAAIEEDWVARLSAVNLDDKFALIDSLIQLGRKLVKL